MTELHPTVLRQHSYTADYPCNCFVETLYFFEAQGVVATLIVYEDVQKQKILSVKGGTKEDRLRIRNHFGFENEKVMDHV